MRTRLLTLLMTLFAVTADAYYDAGARFTAGPADYSGFNVFAESGNDDYYLRPALNTYKSGAADRYSTYSLGAGLDRPAWRVSADVSVTPETGGYKNSGFAADLGLSLLGEPDEEAALQDISLSVFAGLTAHEDTYSLSTTTVLGGNGGGGGGGTSVSVLTSALKLNQTDYGLSASVKAYGLRASGRFTKTSYDTDMTAESRQLPVDIGSIGTSGFPDTAISARLRCPGLPLSPEAGYSKTTYLLDQPDSETVNFGISANAGPVEISAGWENYAPGGGAARSDYYTLGLTFSF
ncbi:MAG: hypothetical protein A3J79_05515 [Elusimicrobia bacterium RIFOXYB2_FULL_62_6]|nr:MAG: hypothetical protein A3J79_05515 [Elusimicrobia bacterium RIFOXYB2_FULL_62_6]